MATPIIKNQPERPKKELLDASQESLRSTPESSPEQVRQPEQPLSPEQAAQIEQDDAAKQDALTIPASEPVTTPALQKVVDRLEEEIEDVLEEDLKELYLTMDPQTQQAFKKKGEETVVKIKELVTKAKVNTRKIFALIKDWLKMIPGVNKFFLLQEAKIKTDKILLVAEEEKKRAGLSPNDDLSL